MNARGRIGLYSEGLGKMLLADIIISTPLRMVAALQSGSIELNKCVCDMPRAGQEFLT